MFADFFKKIVLKLISWERKSNFNCLCNHWKLASIWKCKHVKHCTRYTVIIGSNLDVF